MVALLRAERLSVKSQRRFPHHLILIRNLNGLQALRGISRLQSEQRTTSSSHLITLPPESTRGPEFNSALVLIRKY